MSGDDLTQRLARMAEDQGRLMAELQAGTGRLRRLARSVWAVQEGERRRLSMELHDGLGQDLTALKIALQTLREEAPATLRPALDGALDTAARALDQTRELALLLRPRVLDDLGLEPALRWLARTLQARAGLEVQASLEGLEARVDPDLETLAFRLVQEALTNVLKHSGVREARVEIRRDPEALHLRIEDAGRGFDPAHLPSGSGLANLRDRVDVWGGSLALRSAPGRGTRILIRLPLEVR